MPNWKKVVVSGSNAHLSHVTASDGLQGPGSFFVKSDGKVGINNSDPTYKLDVAGNVGLNEYLYHNGDTDTFLRFQADQTDISAGGNALQITTTKISGSATSTGSFGHIFVDGNILGKSDNTTEIGSTPDNGAIKKIYMVQGGEIAFGDTTTSNFFGISEGTNNSYGDSDTMGIYYRNGLNIYSSNNSQRLKIDGNGNVGINDTTPSYKLDVNGTAQFVDDVTLGADISGSATSTGSFGHLLVDGTSVSPFAGAAGTEALFSGSSASTGSFGRVQVDSKIQLSKDIDATLYGGASGLGMGRAFEGTGNPAATLHISSSLGTTLMKLNGPADSNGLEIIGPGTAENYPLLKLQSNDGNTEVLYAAKSGNVGFGATSGLKGKVHVVGNIHTTTHITASGNFSQSLQSTGSFGRIEASTLAGHSPLVIDADINFGAGADISGSVSSTGSFGRVEATKLAGDGSEITGLTAAAIQTYSSAGDNRVITSVNGTSVQGESGLTFDGSTLEVNGAITSTGNITTLGDIIAENYIVSSSVTHMTQSFSSGSTIFGDTPTDTHRFTGSLDISGSVNNATPTLKVHGSGSGIFEVKGTNGTLFSVNDIMSGSIFSANTIAGIPVIEAFSDQKVNLGPVSNQIQIDTSGNLLPGADAEQDLGSSSKRFANIYSADFHLSNENTQGNDIDGTNGNWTIQEGEEDLYLLNNKNGKKYKFKLEEIK